MVFLENGYVTAYTHSKSERSVLALEIGSFR